MRAGEVVERCTSEILSSEILSLRGAETALRFAALNGHQVQQSAGADGRILTAESEGRPSCPPPLWPFPTSDVRGSSRQSSAVVGYLSSWIPAPPLLPSLRSPPFSSSGARTASRSRR